MTNRLSRLLRWLSNIGGDDRWVDFDPFFEELKRRKKERMEYNQEEIKESEKRSIDL